MTTTLDRPGTEAETTIDIDTAFRDIVGHEEKVEDGTGDHERLSHYVSKEDIIRSYATGEPIQALCGKKWTPRRNPEKFPVCPECESTYKLLADA